MPNASRRKTSSIHQQKLPALFGKAGAALLGHAVGEGFKFSARQAGKRVASWAWPDKKQKTDVVKMVIQHNDLAEKYWSTYLHPPHKIAKFKHDSVTSYYWMKDGNISNGENVQAATMLFSIFTPQHFTVGANTNPGRYFEKCIFDLDPNTRTTGGPGFPAHDSPLRYAVLHDVTGDIHLLNRINVPAECTLYWVMAKQNTVRDPVQEWEFQLQLQAAGQGGADVASGAAGVANSTQYLNVYPFETKGFRDNFKLLHKDSIVMQGNSQIKIKFKIGFNKVISEARVRALTENAVDPFSNFVNQPYSLKGVTVHCFLVSRGSAVVNKASEADVGKIVYSQHEIGWITSQKDNLSFVSNQQKVPNQRYFPFITQGTNLEYNMDTTDQPGLVKTV